MIEDICRNLSLDLTRLEPRRGRRISVRFAEAAALPCIHRMCSRVWDSKSGKVRLGAQVRHREGALGGSWGALGGLLGLLGGLLGGLGGFLGVLGGPIALLASFWGLLVGLLGAQGCQNKKFWKFGVPARNRKGTKRAPKTPPQIHQNEPKRAPKAPSRAHLILKHRCIKNTFLA